MSEAAHTVTVQLNAGARVKAGDTLIVQNTTEGHTVSDGLRSIGQVATPCLR